MRKENFQLKNKTPGPLFPKAVVFLFILIILVVPFYESKRVIIWGTQRETQRKNVFHSLVLSYASWAERLKGKAGLSGFFEKEHWFWLKLKKSPIVFKETPITEKVKKEEKKVMPEKEMKSFPVLKPPYQILIVGDSFIAVGGGVGDSLERALLAYKQVKVKRLGRVSSGLSRPDYFNWNLTAKEAILEQKPNVAIVMLGSNDAQALTTSKGKAVVNFVYVGKEKWNKEYTKRVSEFLNIFKKHHIIVFWVGLPVMKNKNFSDKIKNLNSIYEKEAQNYENVYFVSSWELFTDENGNYIGYLLDKKGKKRLVRASDGIHLTHFGGKILVKKIIEKMNGVMKLELKGKKTK